MAKKYVQSSPAPLTVEEMPPVTATSLKNEAGEVLDQVVREGAVAVTRHGKPRAVLLSLERYAALAGGDRPDWLEAMHEEYRGMLEAMQSPEQKAAAERLFEATSEELGAAAVRAASRKNRTNH